MYNLPYISGLGLTASHRRNILPGTEYDKYFPKPDGTDPYLKDAPTVFDTLDRLDRIVATTLSDTKRIAQVLKRPTVRQTCEAIFDFCYKHIQYKLDKNGVEQLRRPARAWADRRSGIDCDCFTIFVRSILTNLNIPNHERIIELDSKGYYQHIYAIVPTAGYKPGQKCSGYITIDPVLDKFDKEAPGITKISDRVMKVQYLNGAETFENVSGAINDFTGLSGLEGLGSVHDVENQFFGWLRGELEATRGRIMGDPRSVAPLYDANTLLGALEYALENLHNEANYPRIAGLDGLYHSEILEGIEDELFGVGYAMGRAASGKKPAFFTKVATAAKAVKTEVKKAQAKAATTAKSAVKKTAEVAKTAAKATARYNPLSTVTRGGFLLAMETNMFGIANQLRWAYATDEQLTRNGITKAERDAAKAALAKVEKMFVDVLQGKPEMLKKAILSGKQKLSGVLASSGNDLLGLMGLGSNGNDFYGALGEPVTATAGTTAAMTFILKAKDFVKNLKITPKVQKLVKAINDNPKLKEMAKNAINKIAAKNDVAPSATNPTPEPDPEPTPTPPASENYSAPPASENNSSPDPGATNPDALPAAPDGNPDTGGKPKSKNNTVKWVVGGLGVLALIGIGVAVSKSGKKKGSKKAKNKGLSGTDNSQRETVDVEAEVIGSAPLNGTKKRRKPATKKAKPAKKTQSYQL